jgi:HAD superfamily hydrolase (TIGR01509 family)
LDGVLVDSESVWETVRRDFVVRRGGKWSDEIQRNLMGMSTAEWARYLAEQLPGEVSSEQVATEVITRMREQYARSLPLVDGARDVVVQMAARWSLGLASSSPRELVDDVLSLAGLTAEFATVISADEVPRGKPAPDVYDAVFARLAAPANECAAVEDSSNGIRAAHAAGAHVVAVPNRQFPPAPEALALASVVLDNLHELTPECVNRLAAPRELR